MVVGRALGYGNDPETTVQPMRSMLVLLMSGLLTVVLVGCGSKVGQIPFTVTGKTEAMIDAGKESNSGSIWVLKRKEQALLPKRYWPAGTSV